MPQKWILNCVIKVPNIVPGSKRWLILLGHQVFSQVKHQTWSAMSSNWHKMSSKFKMAERVSCERD